jgi:hypothetical protein
MTSYSYDEKLLSQLTINRLGFGRLTYSENDAGLWCQKLPSLPFEFLCKKDSSLPPHHIASIVLANSIIYKSPSARFYNHINVVLGSTNSPEIIKRVHIKIRTDPDYVGSFVLKHIDCKYDPMIPIVSHIEPTKGFRYSVIAQLKTDGFDYVFGCTCPTYPHCHCNLNYFIPDYDYEINTARYYEARSNPSTYFPRSQTLVDLVKFVFFNMNLFSMLNHSMFLDWVKSIMLLTQKKTVEEKCKEMINCISRKLSIYDLRDYLTDPIFVPFLSDLITTKNYFKKGEKYIIHKFVSMLIDGLPPYSSALAPAGAGAGAGAGSTSAHSYEIFRLHSAVIKLLTAFNNYNMYIKSLFSAEDKKTIKEFFQLFDPIEIDSKEKKQMHNMCLRYKRLILLKPIVPAECISELDCFPLKIVHDCTLCGASTMTIDTSCCCQQLCYACISSLHKLDESGIINLFPKCPFCRVYFNDDMLCFDENVQKRYIMLRRNVINIVPSKVFAMVNDYYFCICRGCKLCFPVQKSCALDLENLPKECEKCDVSAFVERCCPTCGCGIVKNGGCNNIKCFCGESMCWLCGEKVRDHDSVHFMGNYYGTKCVSCYK